MRTKNRLRELRLSKGHISQRGFAKFVTEKLGCKVSYVTISNIEKQKGNPTWNLLDTLATYFGVTIDYLMGRTNINVLPQNCKRNAPKHKYLLWTDQDGEITFADVDKDWHADQGIQVLVKEA